MYVVFENCTWEIKDEMSAELFFCAGVQIEDIDCGALDPITFHQLVTNILPRHKNTDDMLYSTHTKYTQSHGEKKASE